jgi:ribosomal protein S12 methylthiotransferase accessory factor
MEQGPSAQVVRALGISRLARVTGMDRTGVEVVAAVRPGGHVLQVTQGKGLSTAAAAWSAVGEAAELHAAEHPEPSRLVFAAGAELDGLVLDDDGLRRAWVRGARLSDDAPVWVSAERVYCPPAGSRWLGPSTRSWSSNGLAAHATVARAKEHAALELWERHALSHALPTGWTPDVARAALVSWAAPTPAFEREGLELFHFLLAARPFPLAAALLFDRDEPSVPLTAGYACRRSLGAALDAAALEAAQSRVTEIHGARDDVVVGAREPALELLEVLRASPRRRPPARGLVRGWPRAVAERIVMVELTARPLAVVKAVGIELDESELLR